MTKAKRKMKYSRNDFAVGFSGFKTSCRIPEFKNMLDVKKCVSYTLYDEMNRSTIFCDRP